HRLRKHRHPSADLARARALHAVDRHQHAIGMLELAQ
ncbi:MAG: hypothetical protein RLZZ498_1809, partial [Pseudomonadota bacterium]